MEPTPTQIRHLKMGKAKRSMKEARGLLMGAAREADEANYMDTHRCLMAAVAEIDGALSLTPQIPTEGDGTHGRL